MFPCSFVQHAGLWHYRTFARWHATFLKDRPVHHEQGWHEDDEDSDAIRVD